MPIRKSAKKSLRQTKARTQKNKLQKAEIETLKKKFLKAVEDQNEGEAKNILLKLQKKLDKAVSVNLVKKNTASRVKSRLAIRFNKQFAKK